MLVQAASMDTISQIRTDFFRSLLRFGSMRNIIQQHTKELISYEQSIPQDLPDAVLYPVNATNFATMVNMMEARYIIARLGLLSVTCHRVVESGFDTHYILCAPNTNGYVYTIYTNTWNTYMSLQCEHISEIKGYEDSYTVMKMQELCEAFNIDYTKYDS